MSGVNFAPTAKRQKGRGPATKKKNPKTLARPPAFKTKRRESRNEALTRLEVQSRNSS